MVRDSIRAIAHGWRPRTCLADIARCQGQFEESIELSQESLTVFKELGDSSGVAWSLQNLGYGALRGGDYERATAYFREALALRVEQESKEGVLLCLAGLAEVASGKGDHERAARLFGAAAGLLGVLGLRISPADLSIYERDKASTRAAVGDEEFTRLAGVGSAFSMEEAVAYVLRG